MTPCAPGPGAAAGPEGTPRLPPYGEMPPDVSFDSAMSTATSRWRIADTSKEVLEQEFRRERFPSASSRLKLAESLDVEPRRIQVWFQNRRQRDRGPPPDTPDLTSTDSSSICSESSAPLPIRPVRSAPLPNAATASAATAAAATNMTSRPSWFQPLDAASSRRDEGYRLPFPASASEAQNALRSKQDNPASEASKRKRPPYDPYPVSAEGQDMEARQTIGSILSSSCDVVNALMGFESVKDARFGSDDVDKMSRESDRCSVDSSLLLSDNDTLWSFSSHEISKPVTREMMGDTHGNYTGNYGNFAGACDNLRHGQCEPEAMPFMHASAAIHPMAGISGQGVLSYPNPDGHNQSALRQPSLPMPNYSEQDDIDSWKNAADAVNSVLSSARRQYSLAVGKLGNLSAAPPALMGSFPNQASQMGACDDIPQLLKKPSCSVEDLRPVTKGGGGIFTGSAFEGMGGVAGTTSGSASGLGGASCESGAQSVAGLWDLGFEDQSIFSDFDEPGSDMRAMKFEYTNSHALMSDNTDSILF